MMSRSPFTITLRRRSQDGATTAGWVAQSVARPMIVKRAERTHNGLQYLCLITGLKRSTKQKHLRYEQAQSQGTSTNAIMRKNDANMRHAKRSAEVASVVLGVKHIALLVSRVAREHHESGAQIESVSGSCVVNTRARLLENAKTDAVRSRSVEKCKERDKIA